MEDIYKKIWELAKPYYEKGRPMDLDHVEWMIGDAEQVCEKEGIDKTIFLPLVILHDTGYSQVQDPKSILFDPFKTDIRRAHMEAGEKISKKILESINYDSEKIKKISYYISVHDNWALEDSEIFLKDSLLGAFNDLDFMWMATPKGFSQLMKIRQKNPTEMLEYLLTNDKLTKRPFANKTTKELFEKYISDRKKEVKKTD
jgi:hypothetical protein